MYYLILIFSPLLPSFVSVKELHKEFALSGADVLQAFVFYGNDDKLNIGRDESNRVNVSLLFEVPIR